MKKRLLTVFLAALLLAPLGGRASANNTKLIALSFDDGPNGVYTAELLDALAARDVKATFFLVGRCVAAYPKLAAREAAEGHQLACHTWSHAWLTKLSAADVRGEVAAGAAALAKATGQTGPFYLRAPYGAVDETVRAASGAPIILWSIDPGSGSMKASEESMKQNVLRTAFDGGIIILHDSSRKNINVALYAIDQLRAQGYEFVTVEELFRLRGVTPQNGQVYYKAPPTRAEQCFDETCLAGHWAAADIAAVEKAGIMNGCGDGFYPNAWLTRAQAVETLWRMAGSPSARTAGTGGVPAPTLPVGAPASAVSAASAATGFADVRADAWYARSASWAHERGCVCGNDGRFCPDAYMTKEELYTMLARWRKARLYAAPQVASPAVYRDDGRISDWAGESVALFRNAGFASKNDRQIFRPKDYATRAEAAELLNWMLKNVK